LMLYSKTQRTVKPEDLYSQVTSIRSQRRAKVQANEVERQRIEDQANWKFGSEGY
jgi:hypothetical protein